MVLDLILRFVQRLATEVVLLKVVAAELRSSVVYCKSVEERKYLKEVAPACLL